MTAKPFYAGTIEILSHTAPLLQSTRQKQMFPTVSKCLWGALYYTSSKQHSSVLYTPNKTQDKR